MSNQFTTEKKREISFLFKLKKETKSAELTDLGILTAYRPLWQLLMQAREGSSI